MISQFSSGTVIAGTGELSLITRTDDTGYVWPDITGTLMALSPELSVAAYCFSRHSVTRRYRMVTGRERHTAGSLLPIWSCRAASLSPAGRFLVIRMN